MELLYLWIDRYNNILNQGFNFSSEYNFTFDSETNTLQVKQLKKKELNLFNESFLNITAIIGKNGSGKSSIFSVLKEIFSEDFYHHNKFLMVTREVDGKLYFHKKAFNDKKNFIVKNTDKVDIIEFDSKSRIFNSVDLIFNSNSFSIYDESLLGYRYFDISFNGDLYGSSMESNKHLIEQFEDINTYWEENKLTEEDMKLQKTRLINGILPQNLLYNVGLRQKIDFITHYSDEKFDFVPTRLNLSFNQSFIRNNLKTLKEEGLENLIMKLELILFSDNTITNNDENFKAKFKKQVVIFLFLYIFINRLFYQIRNFNLEGIIEELNKTDLLQIPESIIKIISGFDVLSTRLECYKIKDLVNNLDKLVDDLQLFYNNTNSYSVLIDESTKLVLSNINDFWQGPDYIFKFWWHGLSDGQSALLTLFAKFYYASKYYITNNKTVWFLLDEGDLYLHPEWQRQLFYDLHKYLPLLFSGKRIQLFLTSHSPFLVSDLPKDNVLLLDADKNGFSLQVERNKFGNTFGANINELLATSFFLNKGFVGEFAREKIDGLFKHLNSKDTNLSNTDAEKQWTSSTALELIELIGEPIVKRTLLQIYDKKFDSNREIQFLASEIRKLNKRRKKRDKNKP